ncbi:MAG: DUF3857 domain-containing protein [Cytophagales bacterium]|nr:DUF3857 domain-containing protein [Cytophagales bacterium]
MTHTITSVPSGFRLRVRLVWLLAAFGLLAGTARADDYEDAWRAIGKNDRRKAQELLLKAAKQPHRAADAYASLIWLSTFNGRDADGRPYFEKLFTAAEDPYPYVYGLWFNGAVLDNYGKKSKEALKTLDNLLADPRANGTIKADLRYSKGVHFLFANQYPQALKEWSQVGAIPKWQLAGPFDNVSGSGYDKNYAPITQPEASRTFTSADDAPISWFSPVSINRDGWIATHASIRENTAVIYAQSFVYSPQEQDALVCLGFHGTLKVWVNDRLAIAQPEEWATTLDALNAPCRLKKGYNRVLVQLGYTDTSFPYFTVRLTDKNYTTLPGLTYEDKFQTYSKDASTDVPAAPVPLFAEAFFEQKIKSCEVYLRNKKVFEAQRIANEALRLDPDNSMLRFELMQALSKADNRTELVKEIAKIKEADPDCAFSLMVRYDELLREEKYDEAAKILQQYADTYGDDADIQEKRIKLAAQKQDSEEIIRLVNQASAKYPDHKSFVLMQYNLRKRVYKDPRGALKQLDEYAKENFNVDLWNSLANEYIEQGMNDKGLKILEKLQSYYPEDPAFLEKLTQFYYGTKNIDKALTYANQQLALAPYYSEYWETLGALHEANNAKSDALAAYKKCMVYNQNSYTARRKIQQLEGKADLVERFPKNNAYDLIKASSTSGKQGKHDWYYVLDQKDRIVHREGTSELYYTIALKIVNEKGVDYWKETNIPYNGYTERLVIEKAEVVKKNGSKVAAERNDNVLVFPNLEKEDGIYIRYKLESYKRGRLAREFWDKYNFDAFVPSEKSRYCLLIDNTLTFDYKLSNSDVKPAKQEAGEYTLYTWEMAKAEALKEENLMPTLNDVGKVLHISSIKNWQDIADWYSDVSSSQAKADFEVKEVYKTLFKDGQKYTELERAKIIYEYVVKTISYSSIPFRQSAYVPQRTAKTVNTKLGDCKDVSTLYATLAREAGLTANLVLINTRDNGSKDLLLPSPEFNHCIVKVKADGKTYFLELTDANLPFGCLPSSDVEAMCLEIPYNGDIKQSVLQPLKPANRVPETISRITKVTVDKGDLTVQTKTVRRGAATSSTRDTYASLDKEKQIETLKKSVGRDFKNPVQITDVNFYNLDKMADSVNFDFAYKVKNEVVDVGELRMIKLPFSDVFVRNDDFQEETRNHPVSYWRYEDMDEYREQINIQLPEGRQFSDLPANLNTEFNGTKYRLTFRKVSPGVLQVTREIKIDRKDIQASSYAAFKDFVGTITAAESKYVVFKAAEPANRVSSLR